MYYPYLRGRQFELIALREFAEIRGVNNNVIPIIEPVKKSFNSLRLAIPKLMKGKVKFGLILNPQVGEIEGAIDLILEELSMELHLIDNWIPVFIVLNNYTEVHTLITESKLEGVMIICTDQTDTDNADFIKLIESGLVKAVISEENRSLKRFLKDKNIDIIRLDDKFKAEKRNSDYLEMEEEKFTEEHYYYKEDGYDGFSDYTVLSSLFTEGGGAPYAVAIHLTYLKTYEQIWIRHFTSTSNFDRANIQGKFAEAVRKAVGFLHEKDIQTVASQELINYYNDTKYPGLGMVKKIAVKHHIETINNSIRD